MSLISIGLSGLNASSAAMTTIGNNTANVDTLGYSRQQTMSVANAQQNIGVGFVGTGTTLSDVRRVYNSFLNTQLQSSTALSSDASAYLTEASKLDSLLSESSTGVSKVLANFFTALQNVSSNANDSASRDLFLKSAQTLTSQFNSIASQMKDQSASVNSQLGSMAGKVNALASSIASLNLQITQARGTGAEPNSLLDSREEAVRQLNELVGAKAVEGSAGYDIYIGSGQPLVVGGSANTLSASPSDGDPSTYALKLNYQNGTTDVSSVVTGGSIGGLLRYRSEVLQPATNELGRLAMVVSDQINNQLNQGVDSNGEFGASLFNNINDPTLTAQRSVGAQSNSAGSGNFDVSINDTGALTTNNYKVTFSDTDPTKYSVKRLPDGNDMGTYTLGAPADIVDANGVSQGITLSFSGTVKGGDSFTVSPTKAGAESIKTVMTDTKTIAAAAPLTGGVGAANQGTGQFGQPTLETQGSAYDTTTSTADLRNAIKAASPMRLVFGDVVAGAQSYKLVDASGQPVLDDQGAAITGNIVPGESNDLSFTVGYGTGQSFKFGMTVSGSPTSADTYNIAMTGAGSADNRNASTTLDLQNKQTVDTASNNGTGMTMSGANTHLVQSVGAQAAQGKSDSAATSTILTQAKGARDSVSGVSMDEEAANLVKYQQYYTASSQIIKAAQSIFDTLINSL